MRSTSLKRTLSHPKAAEGDESQACGNIENSAPTMNSEIILRDNLVDILRGRAKSSEMPELASFSESCAYSRFSTLGSTTFLLGSTATKYSWCIGPLTVSENDTSQNGIGCWRNSWVSSAPT